MPTGTAADRTRTLRKRVVEELTERPDGGGEPEEHEEVRHQSGERRSDLGPPETQLIVVGEAGPQAVVRQPKEISANQYAASEFHTTAGRRTV